MHPETPVGGKAVSEVFPDKAHGVGEYLQNFAASFGITNMIMPERMPNTRRAIAAAEFARDNDKLHDFRRAAMTAYWRDGRDLEDSAVIAKIAKAVGLDPRETVAATDAERYLSRVDFRRWEAMQAGVTGIPFFIIGNEKVAGCHPYEKLAAIAEQNGAVRRDADKAGL